MDMRLELDEDRTIESSPRSRRRLPGFLLSGDRHVTAQLAIELEAFAERIGRIRVVGRNGDLEPFYLDRSQARQDALQLAEWARTGRRPGSYELAAERGRADESRTRYSQR